MADPPAPENPQAQAQAQAIPQAQAQNQPQVIHQHVNWCHFKPEFSDKPEEDVEAHLLRTNDWMLTHDFAEEQKTQRFRLTLIGEARLWYESIAHNDDGWPALQDHFRCQYSRVGGTPEQLCHQWRTLNYDESADTIDSYVIKLRQLAALLGYGELQMLETFKNTVPGKIYWALFPINNFREAIDTAKRVMAKEGLDKQRMGQSSVSPFIKVSSNIANSQRREDKRAVTFDAADMRDKQSDSIDRLSSLVSKLNMTMEKREYSQYKPKVYQGRNCSRHRQDSYQSRNHSWSKDRRNYHQNRYRPNYRDRDRSRNRYNHDSRQCHYRSNERRGNYQPNNRQGRYRPNDNYGDYR